jgi:hypothetical protein
VPANKAGNKSELPLGERLSYSIADDWLPKILEWLKIDPSSRYDAAMNADGCSASSC